MIAELEFVIYLISIVCFDYFSPLKPSNELLAQFTLV